MTDSDLDGSVDLTFYCKLLSWKVPREGTNQPRLALQNYHRPAKKDMRVAYYVQRTRFTSTRVRLYPTQALEEMRVEGDRRRTGTSAPSRRRMTRTYRWKRTE
jgi:hypothetical protein